MREKGDHSSKYQSVLGEVPSIVHGNERFMAHLVRLDKHNIQSRSFLYLLIIFY